MLKRPYVVILFVLFLFSHLSYAQELVNSLVSPGGDTIAINAIPLAEIPNRVESTSSNINKIEERVQPIEELIEFDSVFLSFQSEVKNKKAERIAENEPYTLMNIENDLAEWTGLQNELNYWKDLINDRITTLQVDYFDIQVLEATWNKTIAGYKDKGVPESVLSSEKDILKRIIKLKSTLQDAKTETMRKQNSITDLMVNIESEITLLDNKRKEIRSNYFKQDSPPLWQVGDTTSDIQSLRDQVVNTKNETIRNLQNFYLTSKGTIYLQLLLFFLLWVALYFLHRTSIKIDDDKQVTKVDDAKKLISNYGVSALILTLFSSVWLYPKIPPVIGELLQLIYIVIGIIILPVYVNPKLKKVLYHFLILFIVYQIQDLLSGKILFSRLFIFAEVIYAGWILYLMISPKKAISSRALRKRWALLYRILPIFYLFLAFSLIANVFGYFNLSMVLKNTVVNSLFNVIILILAVMVLDSLLIILIRTPYMQTSNILKHHREAFEKRLFQIIQIFGILIWLRAALRILGLYESLTEWFNGFLQESYKVGTNTIEIGGIITFFIVIIATILFYKLFKLIIKEEIFPRVKLPRGVPGSISMISGYVIVGFGIYLALGAAFDLSKFGLMAGALGVGIGFGLQGIVANFIAGLVLAFERPIQVGDTIEVGTMMGDVLSIGVRSCTIKTFDGTEVIIPNSTLITNDVTNFTLTDRKRRRDINVGVAYGTDPHVVLELLKKVANEHPGVQKLPAPWALFDGFGDSSLNFRIRIWTTMDDGMSTKSEVTIAIYDALNEAGITIPFPQQDLYIKSLPGGVDEKKSATKKRNTTKEKSDTTDKEENKK